ncbi:anti-virulence regulator CigR family protein [Pantoea sp. C2G6]|uniref:anti-virulence regulator CigR family protein n=1 Tax=Pantoea sp. C2G6 TaxID=3243084 RepID=UPI003EDA0745
MMKNRSKAAVTALTCCLLLTSPALLADPGNGKGNGGGHGKGHSQGHGRMAEGKGSASHQPKKGGDDPWHADADVTFSFARDLARQHGVTGYAPLPPGIAKNLARGKPLPPGIAKRSLPDSMRRGLPDYPGYEWKIVGDNLMLIALSTAVVTTIINNVFD